MSGLNLTGAVSLWAHRTPAVAAAILIGSQARPAADPLVRPDAFSDWDFQLVARRPGAFCSPRWIDDLDCGPARSYVVRKALWKGGLKINATFAGAEADFMILPTWPLRRLHWLSAAGFHRREGGTRSSLQALIHYVRPSWKFLKDAGWLEPLYRRAAELPDPRLSDASIRQLAAEFWCDYRWLLRKLERGELLAAQRTLHLELAEVNFRLRHELSLRRGRPSFEKARRLEQLSSAEELAVLSVSAPCDHWALRAAAEQSAAACRQLLHGLLEKAAPPFCAIPAQKQRQPQHNEQPANSAM